MEYETKLSLSFGESVTVMNHSVVNSLQVPLANLSKQIS